MFKLFKKNRKVKENYGIVFCDTNSVDTAFGALWGTYDTYEAADYFIRKEWNKTKDQKINDGYKVDGAWIVIKKISKKA